MAKRKSLNTVIKLTDEQKKNILDEIKAFYLDVRGDEIGIIEQQQLLDLFIEKLAPVIYNKALDDVQWWYKQQQENMESDYYSLYRCQVILESLNDEQKYSKKKICHKKNSAWIFDTVSGWRCFYHENAEG